MSHPADVALAKHWRELQRAATIDANVRAMVDSVAKAVHDARKERCDEDHDAASTDSASSGAFLRDLASTPFGQAFFLQQLRSMQRELFLHDENTLYAAQSAHDHLTLDQLSMIASLHEKLGRLAVAKRLYSCAASRAHGAAAAIEVERLRRQIEADDARLRFAPTTAGSFSPPTPLEVDRVHHSQLSYDDFVRLYVERRRPVVILGLSESMFSSAAPTLPTPPPAAAPAAHVASGDGASSSPFALASTLGVWTLASLLSSPLSRVKDVPLKYTVPSSSKWAKLEERGCGDMERVLREMGEQRDREIEQSKTECDEQKEDRASSCSSSSAAPAPTPAPSYYVHDYSLPLSCPALLSSLVIPSYFAGDLLQSLDEGSMFRNSWPSLFVGARGSRSSLHVDTLSTHFVMTMMGDKDARKHWTLYGVDDLPLLYPSFAQAGSIDPTFDVQPYSIMSPEAAQRQHERFPLFARARPVETVLRSGDVLFVPHSTPHFVVNLDTTLSISSNLVLHDNLPLFREQVTMMAAAPGNDRMRDVAAQLQDDDAFLKHAEERARLQRKVLEQSDADSRAAPTGSALHLPWSLFHMPLSALAETVQRKSASSPTPATSAAASASTSQLQPKRKREDTDAAIATASAGPAAKPTGPPLRKLKHFF